MNTEYFSSSAKFYNCGDDDGSPAVAYLQTHILVSVISINLDKRIVYKTKTYKKSKDIS